MRNTQILIADIISNMKNRITHPGLLAMNKKVYYQYCLKETTVGNIQKHETTCYLNPINLVRCIVCENPIKNYKTSKGTCSKSCANKHFRSGEDNGNWKGTQYQTICYRHHEKKCVVCGENKIVAVHYMNENHSDNRLENLVPLCPTHHQYVHSRYKAEVIDIIENYVKNYVSNN